MSRDMSTPPLWDWPFSALEIWRRALFGPGDAEPREEPGWATQNRVALELAALRLRDFSTAPGTTPTLVVAPFALHDAQIADLASGHSLIEALATNGCSRLYLVQWKSACHETRLDTIDAHLAALNVVVDDIGAPVDLVGLCQGGWLSLLYAARFQSKTRRIVLVGAPIDVAAEESALSGLVGAAPPSAVDRLISEGGGLVRGERMVRVWPREESEERRLVDSLQLEPPFETASAQTAIAAFRKWDRYVLDLPGAYYRQTLQYLYRQNLLAQGGFPALGRKVRLETLDSPLYLLAGENDCIAPRAQAYAPARLAAGPVEQALAPCGHLALFMGRSTIRDEWPRVARWLLA
jgi:polyhydroxyalkanoate synthase subunit PhaC